MKTIFVTKDGLQAELSVPHDLVNQRFQATSIRRMIPAKNQFAFMETGPTSSAYISSVFREYELCHVTRTYNGEVIEVIYKEI